MAPHAEGAEEYEEMITSRRSFLIGFGALIAAPAIVRATNIMPVRQMLVLPEKISDLTFPIEGFAKVAGIERNEWISFHWNRSGDAKRKFYEYSGDTKIAEFKGKWEFNEHPHNNPAIVTLRDGQQWQRKKGLVT